LKEKKVLADETYILADCCRVVGGEEFGERQHDEIKFGRLAYREEAAASRCVPASFGSSQSLD
jgi:hypothetical protein